MIDWLLAGDPAVRWQVMRDLLDEPPETWEQERARAVRAGCIAELLAHKGPDGEWPKGRWTASTWTLLLLVAYGIPEDHPAGREPLERLFDRFMAAGHDVDGDFLLRRVDLCHLGFWLGLGAHFLREDPRLPPRRGRPARATHGWRLELRGAKPPEHAPQLLPHDLQRAREPPTRRRPEASSRRARSAMPKLGRSSSCSTTACTAPTRTGDVISDRFTYLTYPWHWHYTFLRGLDYIRLLPAIADERLADPIGLLEETRKPNGRWPLQKRIPGHAARRDGETWTREPLEHTQGTPCSASP